jgi:hypothetical protein
VQVAHGGDEGDGALGDEALAKVGNGMDELHGHIH